MPPNQTKPNQTDPIQILYKELKKNLFLNKQRKIEERKNILKEWKEKKKKFRKFLKNYLMKTEVLKIIKVWFLFLMAYQPPWVI